MMRFELKGRLEEVIFIYLFSTPDSDHFIRTSVHGKLEMLRDIVYSFWEQGGVQPGPVGARDIASAIIITQTSPYKSDPRFPPNIW